MIRMMVHVKEDEGEVDYSLNFVRMSTMDIVEKFKGHLEGVIELVENYREKVFEMIPTLEILDNLDVNGKEIDYSDDEDEEYVEGEEEMYGDEEDDYIDDEDFDDDEEIGEDDVVGAPVKKLKE